MQRFIHEHFYTQTKLLMEHRPADWGTVTGLHSVTVSPKMQKRHWKQVGNHLFPSHVIAGRLQSSKFSSSLSSPGRLAFPANWTPLQELCALGCSHHCCLFSGSRPAPLAHTGPLWWRATPAEPKEDGLRDCHLHSQPCLCRVANF